MAYANLISQACADKSEIFCNIRDFICKLNGTYNDYSTAGIGWTLHDSSYVVDSDNPQLNDWFVIKSTGESTKDTLYFKIVWSNNYIYAQGQLVWNTTSHTGVKPYGGTSAFNIYETTSINVDLNIFGDLDQIAIVCQQLPTSTDYRNLCFGKVEKPFEGMSETIAISSSSLSSGSDISITVDSVPASWRIGREIYIWTTTDTLATAKIEKTEIKTISSNTITCDLSNAYTANCRLSEHVGYFSQFQSALGTVSGLIGPNGTVSTQTFTLGYNTIIAGTNVDPGGYENRWGMAPSAIIGASGFLGYFRGIYRVSVGVLVNKDVLETIDQTEYRHLKLYSNTYTTFKEV